MVSSIQPAYLAYSQQQSSSVSQRSKQQPWAASPQDTVTLSESMKDAQAGMKGTKVGGPADIDHDGDSH